MNEFLKWLSSNPILASALVSAITFLLITVALMVTIAFFQGREVTFWPPKIGPRPVRDEKDPITPLQDNPFIQKGSILSTSTGDKVKISSNLAVSSNATLYKAKSLSTNEKVVVKVYWRGLRPNSLTWEFFKQNRRSFGFLTHRNLVKTLDKGLYLGYPFIVMEYFSGGTLRDWLQMYDQLPGDDIFSIASQIADAIDFLHSKGVIHRDIKPSNILLETNPQGRVVLGDFEVSRILGAVERNITAVDAESFVGTPIYIAPEVLMGQEITFAADIYSFGVVLFEMISGCTPFSFNKSSGVIALLQAKTQITAPEIRDYRKNVPENLAIRLAQALNIDPGLRPKSARAILSGLETEITQL